MLSTARSTNEENYITQKFARAALGTNNIDHCARLCHAPTTSGLTMTLGTGAMTNTIPELSQHSDVIFICGSNTAECHPLIARHVIKAQARGAKLIVADPRENEMAKHADLFLRVPLGHDIPLLNAMMHVIIKEGLHKADFLRDHTNGFDDVARAVEDYSPESVAQMTDIPADDIVKAARWYAKAEAAAVLYAMGVTQFTCGTGNVVSVANLALITGQIGRPGAGVCPLRGQSNVQGAGDLGAVPNTFPGGYPVSDAEARARFETAWKAPLSDRPGVRASELAHAILEGKVRALITDGENPMMTDPNTGHFAHALDTIDLLVVTDLFMTETARRAHLVLPASGWGEKDGTFTNTERRIQRLRAAVKPPGESKAAWWIFKNLSERLGYHGMEYGSPEDVWNEVREVVPEHYAGISYRRLDTEPGLCWPCPSEDHPGTPILHVGGHFHTPSGKAELKPVLFHPVSVPESQRKAFEAPIIGHIAERPDEDLPVHADDRPDRHPLSYWHDDAPVAGAGTDRPRAALRVQPRGREGARRARRRIHQGHYAPGLGDRKGLGDRAGAAEGRVRKLPLLGGRQQRTDQRRESRPVLRHSRVQDQRRQGGEEHAGRGAGEHRGEAQVLPAGGRAGRDPGDAHAEACGRGCGMSLKSSAASLLGG